MEDLALVLGKFVCVQCAQKLMIDTYKQAMDIAPTEEMKWFP